jgi:nicotinate-nucleotide adenylyltransferase
MKIGLYFGSFNPIHNGHLIIANHFINETDLDQVWFVVSPQNPFKQNQVLLNEQHRLSLIKAAIDDDAKLKASNIEFGLPKPSYTVNTLVYLAEKFPQHQFVIIMGSDGYQNIGKWKNADFILVNFFIYIYQRPGFEINQTQDEKILITKAPLINISSSYIRDLIKQDKNIRFLVPDSVENIINKELYYKSNLENPSKKDAGKNN